METLSDAARIRFDRQTRIPGWGEAGQERLKNATVGMIGTGGLGSPVAIYDGEMMEFVQTALRRDPTCPVCGRLG